jgi:integrase
MARANITKMILKSRVRWIANYRVPDPATGARKQRRRTFDTRKDALDFLTELRHEQRSGTYLEPSRITLGDLMGRFIAARRTSGKNRGSTIRNYHFSIRSYILPRFGALPLAGITTLTVQEIIDAARTAGSPHAAYETFVVLDMALRQAVRWKLLVASPVAGIVKPEVPRGDAAVNAWTEEQAAAFLAATRDDPRWPLWFVALNTGARCGELTALMWRDIDMDAGTVAIRRTWARDEDGKWVLNPTKTAASHRQIEIGPAVIAVLRDVRQRQRERRLIAGALWRETGHVFDRGDGTGMTPNNEATRLRTRCRWADVPEITFHGLRHTFATTMLRRGVHMRIVQHYLGHSTAYMTAHYSHVQPIMFGQITAAAGEAFGTGEQVDGTRLVHGG